MAQEIKKLSKIPEKLAEIADPPKELFIEGKLPDENFKFLAVVGSRKYSPYGRDACEKLIEGLRGYPVVIVSGLALGIDSIAHTAALKNGLPTVAIPGSGLSESVIYPRTNFLLSRKILEAGGGLLSEFPSDFKATPWSFPQRNRVMAGLCDAVLLIEAQEKSGTLITARLAMEYNRDVLVVPGSIFSKTTIGTNKLIKDGAQPVLSSQDILEVLGFKAKEEAQKTYGDCTPEETEILELLDSPVSKEELAAKYPGSITELNTVLAMLEIKGHIKETMGEIRKV